MYAPDAYFESDKKFYFVNWDSYAQNAALIFQKATLEAPSGIVKINGLVYNTSAQVLVDASNAVIPDGAILKYSFNRNASPDDYTETLPAKTDAGSWSVYCRAYPAPGYEALYNRSSYITITGCSIAKAPNAITAPPTPIAGLVYNGNPKELVNPGTVDHGTMKYSLSGPMNYKPKIPVGIIGTFDVYYALDGGTNYESDYAVQYVTVTIAGPDAITWNDDEDNSDEMEFLNGQTIPNLTIGRSLLRNGDYNTICLPFDLSTAQLRNSSNPLYGCTVSELTKMWTVGNELRLLMSPVNHMEAGKPYLVKYNGEADNL